MGEDGPGRQRRHLLGILSLTLVAAVCCQSDFLNIDCGKSEGYNATDSATTLVYTSDHQYVSTGKIYNVGGDYLANPDYKTQSYDLRSFPDGIRNCYTVPVKPRQKYLARALFMYGNYDGLNHLPVFELLVGVNHWTLVSFTNTSNEHISEVLFVAGAKAFMDFCLVNKGSGTPFISALELRPLPNDLYPQATSLRSLIMAKRYNDGATTALRYPQDPYDRIWTPYTGTFSTLQNEKPVETVPSYQPPSDVLQTAIFDSSGLGPSFRFIIGVDTALADQQVHIFLYFAELRQLLLNESRAFDIYVNDQPWDNFNPVTPAYLNGSVAYTLQPVRFNPLTFVLVPTTDSTLPPILNAEEVYIIGNITGAETEEKDIDAIKIVKDFYKVERNWQGDPCSPTAYTWEGLNCSSDGSESTTLRIVSVNLSSSGLTGEISTALGALTQIQSLDLSGNNLTGEIPAVFANLIYLKYLDLTGNTLDSQVPKSLLDRAQEGLLNLKLGSDPCNVSTSCKATKKSKGKVIIIVVGAIGGCIVLLVIAFVIQRKMRKEPVGPREQRNTTPSEDPEEHPSNSLPKVYEGPKTSRSDKPILS